MSVAEELVMLVAFRPDGVAHDEAAPVVKVPEPEKLVVPPAEQTPCTWNS